MSQATNINPSEERDLRVSSEMMSIEVPSIMIFLEGIKNVRALSVVHSFTTSSWRHYFMERLLIIDINKLQVRNI